MPLSGGNKLDDFKADVRSTRRSLEEMAKKLRTIERAMIMNIKS